MSNRVNGLTKEIIKIDLLKKENKELKENIFFKKR